MTKLQHILFLTTCILFIILCIVTIYISNENCINKYIIGILFTFISSAALIGYLIISKITNPNKTTFIGSNDKETHPVLKALGINISSSDIDKEYNDSISENNIQVQELDTFLDNLNKNQNQLITKIQTLLNNNTDISKIKKLSEDDNNIISDHYKHVISTILIPHYQKDITKEILTYKNNPSKLQTTIQIGSSTVITNPLIFDQKSIAKLKSKKPSEFLNAKVENIFVDSAFTQGDAIIKLIDDIGGTKSYMDLIKSKFDNLIELSKNIKGFKRLDKKYINQDLLIQLNNQNKDNTIDKLTENYKSIIDNINDDIYKYKENIQNISDIIEKKRSIIENKNTIETNYNSKKEEIKSKLDPYLKCYDCYDLISENVLKLKSNYDNAEKIHSKNIAELQTAKERLSVENEKLKQTLTDGDKKIDTLKSEKTAIAKELKDKTAELKDKWSELQTLQLNYNQKVDELDKADIKNVQLNSQLTAINAEIIVKSKEIEQLTTEKKQLELDIISLRKQFQDQKKINDEYKESILQKIKENEKLNIDLQAVQNSNEIYRKTAVAQSATIRDLNEKLLNIAKEKDAIIEPLKQKETENFEKIRLLTVQIGELENNVLSDDDCNTRIKDLRNANENLIKELQTEIDQIKLQNSDLNKEYKLKIQESLKDKEKFNNYIENLCTLYKTNVITYKEQLEEYDNLINDFDGKIETKNNRIDIEKIQELEDSKYIIKQIKDHYTDITIRKYKLEGDLMNIKRIEEIFTSLKYSCKDLQEYGEYSYTEVIQSPYSLYELTNDYFNLLDDINKITKDNKDLNERMGNQTKQYIDLQNKCNPKELEETIKLRNVRIDELVQLKSANVVQIRSLEENIRQLTEQAEFRTKQNTEEQDLLKRQILSLQNEKESLEQRVKELENSNEKFFRRYNPTIIKLINNLTSSNEIITTNVLQDTKTTLDEITKNNENLKIRNDKYHQLLMESVTKIQTYYSTLAEDNIKLKAEITTLKQQNVDLSATIDMRNSFIEEQETKIQELEKKILNYNTNNTIKFNDIQLLNTNLIKLIEQIKQNIEKINENKQSINENNDNLSSLKTKLDEDISIINTLLKNISDLKDPNINTLLENIQQINEKQIIQNIQATDSTIISEIITKYNNSISEITVLQEKNEQSIKEIAKLRAENEQLQSSAKPLNDLVTKKSNDYMTDDNIIDKTKYLITSIFGNFKKASDKNITIENIDLLNQFKTDINLPFEDVINKHNEILNNIYKEHNEIISKNNLKNKELLHTIKQLESKEFELQMSIVTLGKELTKCQNKPNELTESKTEEIEKLQKEKSQLEQKLIDLDQKLQTENTKLTESQNAEIEKFQKEKSELETKIITANQQLEDSKTTNQQLEESKNAEILQLQSKLEKLQTENKQLQSKLEELNIKKEENDKNNQDLIALQLELIVLKTENEKLLKENNLYKEQIKKLLEQLENVNLRNQSLIDKISQLTNEKNTLNDSIQIKVHEQTTATKKEYQDELERLTKENKHYTVTEALNTRDSAKNALETCDDSLTKLNTGSKITNDYLRNEIETKVVEISKIAIELATLKIAKEAYIKELREIKDNTISKREHETIVNALKENHIKEINSLKSQIESLNGNIAKITAEYEEKIRNSNKNLTDEYKDKIAKLESDKQSIINNLTSELELYKQLNDKNVDFVKTIITELLLNDFENSKLTKNNLTSINILNDKIKSLIYIYENKDLIQNSNEIKTQVLNNINEYKKQIIDILYKNSELDKTITDLTTENEKLRNEKQSIEKQLTEYQQSNDQNKDKLQKELLDLTGRYNANLSTLGIIKEELANLKESKKTLTFEKLELEKMNKKISEENVQKLAEIVNENKIKSEELNTKISELNKLIESNKQNYTISIEEKISENDRLLTELNTLKDLHSNLQKDNIRIQTKLNAEIAELKRNIVELTQLKEKLEQDNQSLISQITELNTKNTTLIATIEDLQRQNSDYSTQLNECNINLLSTSNSLQSCNDEKELLKNDVTSLKNNISQKDIEIAELKKLNKKLETDLETAKKNVISGDDFYYFVDKQDINKQNNIIKSKPKNIVMDDFTIFMQNAIAI